MKRMNEVFELPARYVDVVSFTVNLTKGETEAVCNAINNVDALAGALDALLASSIRMVGSSEFYQAQDDAQAALKAYRGAE